jgi:hypothetical protein
MDVIQENENDEGFDVEFIISSGTVGTLYERKASRNGMPNSDESVAESVETVRTPIPAPTPVLVPAPTRVERAPTSVAPASVDRFIAPSVAPVLLNLLCIVFAAPHPLHRCTSSLYLLQRYLLLPAMANKRTVVEEVV